ncbi:MAG: urease accessory protein UreH [Candidatus Binatia bacterium]
MTLLATLGLGFVLGLKHAFDSDHLIAVSTIVTRERSAWRSLWIGLSWGVGHTLTLLLVGLIVLSLKIHIPPSVELSLECLVGVVLIGLGLGTLYDYWRKKVHTHRHTHDDAVHLHFHAHADTIDHQHTHVPPFGLKPLLLGMVHGLAGSAALMLVVLATIPSPALGLGYIAIFGGGSILGMGLVSLLLGLCFSFAADRLHELNQGLRLTVGALSTAFGAWIVIDIGFVQGLFLN